MATVDQAAAELQLLLRGSSLESSAPEYDEARKLYNAMIDRRPAAIVRCADIADVIASLRYPREQGCELPSAAAATTGRGSAAWTGAWPSTSRRCAA